MNTTRFFASASVLALVSALAACTVESSSSSSSGGSSGSSGSSGGGACSTEGTGSIAVVVTGLPEGVAAKVKLAPASGAAAEATASTTLSDRPAGTYAVTAERVAKADGVVRTLYAPSVSTPSVCVSGAEPQTVTIAYSEVGPSGKLWSTNASGGNGQLLGFAGPDLTATGSPAAKVSAKGSLGAAAGRSIAFDKDGNLWTLGATTTDAGILRFPAEGLGASGEKMPDRRITPKLTGCSPGLGAIAFDPSGALWATVSCSDQVVRLSPETLAQSADYTPAPADIAKDTKAPRQIAFDKDGNMWVSDETSLRRYPAEKLAEPNPTSDFELKAKAENDAALPPDALAFDREGNLWVTSFGANALYKLTPVNLVPTTATAEVVPSVVVTVGVTAILDSIAFDEGGGLWLTYGQGKIARLAPEQLATSSGPGAPTQPSTVTTSADLGYAGGLALFPAPAALPIYARFE